jgi:hypothetical protein
LRREWSLLVDAVGLVFMNFPPHSRPTRRIFQLPGLMKTCQESAVESLETSSNAPVRNDGTLPAANSWRNLVWYISAEDVGP